MAFNWSTISYVLLFHELPNSEEEEEELGRKVMQADFFFFYTLVASLRYVTLFPYFSVWLRFSARSRNHVCQMLRRNSSAVGSTLNYYFYLLLPPVTHTLLPQMGNSSRPRILTNEVGFYQRSNASPFFQKLLNLFGKRCSNKQLYSSSRSKKKSKGGIKVLSSIVVLDRPRRAATSNKITRQIGVSSSIDGESFQVTIFR